MICAAATVATPRVVSPFWKLVRSVSFAAMLETMGRVNVFRSWSIAAFGIIVAMRLRGARGAWRMFAARVAICFVLSAVSMELGIFSVNFS